MIMSRTRPIVKSDDESLKGKDLSTLPVILDGPIQAVEVLDDDICSSIKEDEEPDNILKATLYGLAEEQASLKTLRQKKTKEDKDTSMISLRRAMILNFVADATLRRQSLSGQVITDFDLRGPKFREVFKMFLEVISNTFDEVKIPFEYKEMFFHALSKNMEGWESRAEHIVQAMSSKT